MSALGQCIFPLFIVKTSFANQGLFMRFFGGGVGHSSTREASGFFLNDQHPSDLSRMHHCKSPHHTHQAETGDKLDGPNVDLDSGSNERFDGVEEDIAEQDFDQEVDGLLGSDNETGVSNSEMSDFGYRRPRSNDSDKSNEEDRESKSNSNPESQGDDGKGLRDEHGYYDPDDAEWEDVPNDFDALGFASF
ncbi:hypothetical protein EI94DRAFT_1700080 [Lactarius quietus]|nr:hypothetical protein EI94DRAFT_1700080 [Lactarius quietus]